MKQDKCDVMQAYPHYPNHHCPHYYPDVCRTPIGLLPSYSSSDLSKSRCHWTQSCKVAMAICVLVLLAWGIAVPLYFLGEFIAISFITSAD